MRALVAGASGAVGSRLVPVLEADGWDVLPTDLETADVTDADGFRVAVEGWQPDVVFHLAAWKEAGAGELDPAGTCLVNAVGTAHVVAAAETVGARVILASTCKAADPETVYGASKLIAERIVLNAGGSVVRFYNIPECAGEGGNVFSLWAGLPVSEPIPFTDCTRYFVSADQAIAALLAAAARTPGRYAPVPTRASMREMAERLYPGRELVEVPRRRGDRWHELLHAECETAIQGVDGVMRILCPHDPVPVRA